MFRLTCSTQRTATGQHLVSLSRFSNFVPLHSLRYVNREKTSGVIRLSDVVQQLNDKASCRGAIGTS